ncbi:MAG: hypothetical protein AAGH65_06955 [Pseudomonadota bacterium]
MFKFNFTQSKHKTAIQAAATTAVFGALMYSAHASAGSLVYQPDFSELNDNYVPPAVLVGFNPQPEPPARLVIAGDLGNNTPGITLSGIEDESVELLFGVGGGHQRLATMTLVGESCGFDDNIRLFPAFRDVAIPDACGGRFVVRAKFTDRTVFNLEVIVRATRGDVQVAPTNLVGFNPQPEPPAIPSIGLRANLDGTGANGITIDLALSDRRGNPIPLR